MKMSYGAFCALILGVLTVAGCDAETRDFSSSDSGVVADDEGDDGAESDAGGDVPLDGGDDGTDEEDPPEEVIDAGDDDGADAPPDAGNEDTEDEEDAGKGGDDDGPVPEDDAGGEPIELDAGDEEPSVIPPEAGIIAGCQTDDECEDDNRCNGTAICVEGQCIPGERPENGTACAIEGTEGALICSNGNCAESLYGDGLVDPQTSEQCDDGNADDGDGCEVGCTFSCQEATDCDNGNPCDGAEQCDVGNYTCKAGENAQDGATCGDAQLCNAGRCLPAGCGNGVLESATEVCDDGNIDDGDGCDSDCTWTCTGDEGCDDGSVCTGTETCDLATNTCVAGTPLSCVDGDACTEDTCDPVGGCSYPTIDVDGDGYASTDLGACGSDCNDGDDTVYPGAAELCDNKDNNCNGERDELAPTWYVDCDGDGFAEDGAPGITQCDKPGAPGSCGPGLAADWTELAPNNGYDDCYDANSDTHPMDSTQNGVAWRNTGVTARPLGFQFDYNCDGNQEKRFTVAGVASDAPCKEISIIINPIILDPVLVAQGLGCNGGSGWTSASPPACGDYGYRTTCESYRGVCTRSETYERQQCR